ncbi:hypothetical protein QCA50_003956 [Cerrena zonata]|uniref:RlpA-like protein double-psi beta-barrel domain-containing protein n=1 Tax=Cerrena zonata TaxID=2478898 RepID=A0AAW0GFY9_9APHY
MFSLVTLATLTFFTTSTTNAVIIPRAIAPSDYRTDILEPHDTYHARYMAIDCPSKQGSAFFDDCCHPLKLGETLEKNRKAECSPANELTSGVVQQLNTGDNDDRKGEAAPVSNAAPESAPVSAASSTKAPSTETLVKTTKAQGSAASVNTGGVATYFWQNGVAGACGKVHSDSDLIAAIDQERYGDSGSISNLCGKQVIITNLENDKSVTVTIADSCPTCDSPNSIDLSEAAFKQIATLDEGKVEINWWFA